MSVLNEITVGEINYYYVDNKPEHTAPKGSISILSHNFSERIYINNNGGNVWLKLISSSYGSMFVSDRLIQREEDIQNTWVSLANIPLTSGSLKNFIVTDNQLIYNGISTSKCITKMSSTIQGSTRSKSFEIGIAKNLIAPIKYNTSFPNSNTFQKIESIQMDNIIQNDNFIGAMRWLSISQGGGPSSQRSYAIRNMNIKCVKIDESSILFFEDWETGSFSSHNWVVVNDSTNIWTIGTSENFTSGGNFSSYISNDGGTSASYEITTPNISHFYRDFEIPEIDGDILLTFSWKCWAENDTGAEQYDYGSVVITDTTVTPISGTEVSISLSTLDPNLDPTNNGRIGAITNLGKFNEGYGGPDSNWRKETINLKNYKGTTKRLVFSWVNDTSVGNNPPFVIDDIKIEFY